MSESTFRTFERYFWWAYVLLPLITGLLAYSWLTDESYDETRHELIAFHAVDTNSVGGREEVPDKWRSKKTGEIYSRDQFAKHRQTEAVRLSVISFLYGLIGCVVFAYGQSVKKRESFSDAIKMTLIYDAAASFMVLLLIWH